MLLDATWQTPYRLTDHLITRVNYLEGLSLPRKSGYAKLTICIHVFALVVHLSGDIVQHV